jgi:hypothetical protein
MPTDQPGSAEERAHAEAAAVLGDSCDCQEWAAAGFGEPEKQVTCNVCLVAAALTRARAEAFEEGRVHERHRSESSDRPCGCHWWCPCGVQNLAMREQCRRCGEKPPAAKILPARGASAPEPTAEETRITRGAGPLLRLADMPPVDLSGDDEPSEPTPEEVERAVVAAIKARDKWPTIYASAPSGEVHELVKIALRAARGGK